MEAQIESAKSSKIVHQPSGPIVPGLFEHETKRIADEKWAAEYEAETKAQIERLDQIEPIRPCIIPMKSIQSLLKRYPQE